MGKATVVSNAGAGQYTIDVLFDDAGIQDRLTALQNRKIEVEAALTDAQIELDARESDWDAERSLQNALIDAYAADPTPEKLDAITEHSKQLPPVATAHAMQSIVVNTLQLDLTSIDKDIETFAALPASAEMSAWCIDYSEALTGDIGTLEIPSSERSQHINIRPGYTDSAAYTVARDGMIRQPYADSAAATVYNLALQPGVQTWSPRYRKATITSVDGVANTCNVLLEDCTSRYQQIDCNPAAYTALTGVPIEYMSCDSDAFVVGDIVVVEFRNMVTVQPIEIAEDATIGSDVNNNWSTPYVIGFASEPRSCSTLSVAGVPISDSAPTGWGQPLDPPPGTAGGPNPERTWTLSAGAWTYEDADDFGGGLEWGTISWRGNCGVALTWAWRPAGQGNLANGVKYTCDTTYMDWGTAQELALQTEQSEIYHNGAVLTTLPGNLICMGAAVANGWLLAVGCTTRTSSAWVDSGALVTTLYPSNPTWIDVDTGYVFSVGEQIRIPDGSGSSLISLIYDPAPPTYPDTTLVTAFSITAGANVGDSVQVYQSSNPETRMYYRKVTVTDCEVSLVPGEDWAVAETIPYGTNFTQQFCFSPNGLSCASIRLSGVIPTIYRVTWTPGETSVTAVVAAEALPARRFYVDATHTGDIGACAPIDSFTKELSYEPTGTCGCCAGEEHIAGLTTTPSGEELNGVSRSGTETYEATISTGSVSHTMAIDYLPNGDEALLSLDVSYSSTFETVADIEYLRTSYDEGYYSVVVTCPGNPQLLNYNFYGNWENVDAYRGAMNASVSGSTNYECTINLNGTPIITMGSISEVYEWSTEELQTLESRRRIIKGPTNSFYSLYYTSDQPCLSCYDEETPIDIQYVAPFSYGPTIGGGWEVGDENTFDGTTYNCSFFDSMDPQDFETLTAGSPTTYNREFSVLKFCDIAAGVYAVWKKDGRLADVYGGDTVSGTAFDVVPYEDPTSSTITGTYEDDRASVIAAGTEIGFQSGTTKEQSLALERAAPKKTNVPTYINPEPADFMALSGYHHDASLNDSGAASVGEGTLIAVHQPMLLATDPEFRFVTLTAPITDPLTMIGATGTDQWIGKIGAI